MTEPNTPRQFETYGPRGGVTWADMNQYRLNYAILEELRAIRKDLAERRCEYRIDHPEEPYK